MPLITTNLLVHFDASNTSSYPGSGTTVTDLTAGNNGTLVNGTAFTSVRGGAFVFDGINDRLDVAHATGMSMINTSSRTITMWVRWTGSGYEGIVGKQSSNFNFDGYVIGINEGALRFAFNSNVDSSIQTDTFPLSDQRWHHLGITFATSTASNAIRLYVDGQLLKSGSAGTTTATNESNTLRIGSAYHDDSSSLFTGELGEFQLYTSPLSDAGILENYNSTKSRYSNNEVSSGAFTANSESVDPDFSVTSNFNYSQSSIITTALLTMPTIVIVNYDNVEVVTSITVDAEFPEANVSVQSNISNAAELMTASAEEQTHINIAGNGIVFNAINALASAELVEPPYAGSSDKNIILETFGSASANIIQPQVVPTPNYRQLVKRNNPSIYLNSPSNPEGGSFVSTIINDGYDNWGTGSAEINGVTALNAPGQIGAIGNGKALYPLGTDQNRWRWYFNDNNADLASRYIHTPGNNFTIEFWFWSGGTQINSFFLDYGSVVVYSEARRVPIYSDDEQGQIVLIGYNYNYGPAIRFDGDTTYEHFLNTFNSGPFSTPENAYFENAWNHVVITGEYGNFGLTGGGQVKNLQTKIWLNGVLRDTQSGRYVNNSVTDTGESAGVTGYVGFEDQDAGFIQKWYFSEFATYKSVLSDSEILEHFTFINESSPNRLINAVPFTSNAFLINPTILAVDNVTFPQTPVTASAELFEPTFNIEVGDIYNAEAMEASSEFVEPFFFGDPDATVISDTFTAYAEVAPQIYRLDTAYYSYVQANIAPHRYVTFDVPISTKDWGSDNDYSNAAPFVYDGIITEANDGLANNSLLSSGTNYLTSGLIMKESEWDDDWGTGLGSYHSSYWIKRSPEDIAPNGLRIIQCAYSEFNNAFGILYQYQNQIHFEIFNGTDYYTASSTVGVNVFDYAKHHIVVNFRFTGTNHFVDIYVDKQLVISQNVGAETLAFVNSDTFLPPNTETNNKSRMSIGALIVPIELVSIPVLPTPTKMFIDEVHWAQTSINQTGVNNLYAAMPFKTNIEWNADVFLGLDSFIVEPAVGTGYEEDAVVMTASAEMVEPEVIVEFGTDNLADIMEASALQVEPFSVFADNVTNIEIFAETLVASGLGPQGGAIISIPGQTMYANAQMATSIRPYADEFVMLVTQLITYGNKNPGASIGTAASGTWQIGDIE